MNIVFTKSSSPLSILIRWALNEPVSHCAIVFDDKIVFHANLLGLHIDWFNTFKKHSTVIYKIDCPMDLAQEELLYKKIIDKEDGKSYDFRAFAYFGWRAFLKKCFGFPLPTENKWESKTQDLCIEVIRYLDGEVPLNIPSSQALSMLSPYQVYLILAAQRPIQQDQ